VVHTTAVTVTSFRTDFGANKNFTLLLSRLLRKFRGWENRSGSLLYCLDDSIYLDLSKVTRVCAFVVIYLVLIFQVAGRIHAADGRLGQLRPFPRDYVKGLTGSAHPSLPSWFTPLQPLRRERKPTTLSNQAPISTCFLFGFR
jgi:hypothetical protein